MPVPWLRILDAVIGVTDLARSRRIRQLNPVPDDPQQQLEVAGRGVGGLGGFEARLAGVVVAALKEAFDRDTRRLELERSQLEAERERAERTLRLELLRQSGEREIGRLRLLAGVAGASWIATLVLFVSGRIAGLPARTALGGGWLLLLAAIATSFVAQARVAAVLDRASDESKSADALASGIAGALPLWLIVLGLGLIGLAVVVA